MRDARWCGCGVERCGGWPRARRAARRSSADLGQNRGGRAGRQVVRGGATQRRLGEARACADVVPLSRARAREQHGEQHAPHRERPGCSHHRRQEPGEAPDDELAESQNT